MNGTMLFVAGFVLGAVYGVVLVAFASGTQKRKASRYKLPLDGAKRRMGE